MRVNILSPEKVRCGISDYSDNLANALNAIGGVEARMVDNQLTIQPFRTGNFASLAEKAAQGCDVLHVQHEWGLFGLYGVGSIFFYRELARRARVPVVATIHEMTTFCGASTPVRKGRERVGFSFLLPAVDEFIVHNRASRDALSEYTKKPIHVFPIGIKEDAQFLDSRECKRKLGLDGKRVLAIFGFIKSHKGYETAIELVERLGDDCILLIAGAPQTKRDEAYWSSLSGKIKDKKNIRYLGFVKNEDIPTVFNAADIFLYPYKRVTASAALAEAMAYKKPCLCSRIPPFKEVEDAYGSVKTFGTVDEAALIVRFLFDEPGSMEELESKVKKYYSFSKWSSVAEMHAKLYSDLLSRRK